MGILMRIYTDVISTVSMAISGNLEVPAIYKVYFSGLCKGISTQNTALYGTVPPFQDPEIRIGEKDCKGIQRSVRRSKAYLGIYFYTG